jgi:hypothetical protein
MTQEIIEFRAGKYVFEEIKDKGRCLVPYKEPINKHIPQLGDIYRHLGGPEVRLIQIYIGEQGFIYQYTFIDDKLHSGYTEIFRTLKDVEKKVNGDRFVDCAWKFIRSSK